MSKWFSIPGTSISSSDDRETEGVDPRRDPRFSSFYAERERRRREDQDRVASGFTAGDQVAWNGEKAVVEGVEYDSHSGTETTWMRGEKSGTWTSRWQKTADDTAVITESKRTYE